MVLNKFPKYLALIIVCISIIFSTYSYAYTSDNVMGFSIGPTVSLLHYYPVTDKYFQSNKSKIYLMNTFDATYGVNILDHPHIGPFLWGWFSIGIKYVYSKNNIIIPYSEVGVTLFYLNVGLGYCLFKYKDANIDHAISTFIGVVIPIPHDESYKYHLIIEPYYRPIFILKKKTHFANEAGILFKFSYNDQS